MYMTCGTYEVTAGANINVNVIVSWPDQNGSLQYAFPVGTSGGGTSIAPGTYSFGPVYSYAGEPYDIATYVNTNTAGRLIIASTTTELCP